MAQLDKTYLCDVLSTEAKLVAALNEVWQRLKEMSKKDADAEVRALDAVSLALCLVLLWLVALRFFNILIPSWLLLFKRLDTIAAGRSYLVVGNPGVIILVPGSNKFVYYYMPLRLKARSLNVKTPRTNARRTWH